MDSATPDIADLTLDELRLALAPAVADAAVFDGWSDEALVMAADQLGADVDVARLAFKDGPLDMVFAWIDSSVHSAAAEVAKAAKATMAESFNVLFILGFPKLCFEQALYRQSLEQRP